MQVRPRNRGDKMSDETPVTMVARLTPAAGCAAQLQALLEGMIAPTRSEPGCRAYDLFTTEGDSTDFLLLERYEHTPALESHRTSAHYKAYRAQLPDLLARPIDVSVITPVDVLV